MTIDLVIETEKEIMLFEVKTGSDSQSIYTGIGQLYFHAAALSRKFPDKPVVRYLVIPIISTENNRETILNELGIEIITFKLANNRIIITSGI